MASFFTHVLYTHVTFSFNVCLLWMSASFTNVARATMFTVFLAAGPGVEAWLELVEPNDSRVPRHRECLNHPGLFG